MQIGGSIDTTNIERGLTRIETGFKGVESVGKGVNADFERINQQAIRLGKAMGALAIAGGTAMIAMAKGSPAVAGAMAKIGVTMGKLSRTLGEALSPAFNMASESLQRFLGWIENNKESISSFATDVIGGLTTSVSLLGSAWGGLMGIQIPIFDVTIGEGLKWLTKTFGAELISGLVVGKFLGGPAGLAAAGAVSVIKSEEEGRGWATVGGLTGAALGSPFGPGGIGLGFGAGALIGRGIDLYLSKQDRKSTSLDLEYML